MAEKRRIFIVITQGEEGGAQRFVAQLTQEINRDKFRLHVVWGSDSGMALASHLPEGVTYATAGHLVRNIAPWHDLKAIGELRAQMRAFRPDVVLCISSKAGFVGARAAHGLRAEFPNLKVIYRIGGWAFNDPRPQWQKKLYQLLERSGAKWKDVIVVNNAHDLVQAKELGIVPRQGKVLRIPNGIDPYLPFPSRQEALQALERRLPEFARLQRPDWTIGTIANLYPAKDLANFIRAASRIGGKTRFIIIGDGPEREKLHELALAQGLEGRLFFLGRIPHAWRLLPAFDIFALSSAKEGFPWALLEAMAAKIPVVATSVGAVPEMLQDHQSGIIVPPGNPGMLAEGIVELIGDERKRQEYPIAGHQQIITKFSLRDMIAQYEHLLS